MLTRFVSPSSFVSLIVTASLIPARLANADVVEAAYGGSNSFVYVLTGMEDLDQRRDGIPNNGNWYCVPTATLDVMCYIASHGFPQVAPGDHLWQSQDLYPTATGHEALMGIMMGTSATSGTGASGMLSGTNAWLGSNLFFFTVSSYQKNSSWAPTIQNLAEAATNGKLVTFTYGRYQYLSQNSTTAFVSGRTGGHRVVLVKAEAAPGHLVIGVRDPADEPDKPDPENPQPDDNPNWLSTQSPYSNRVFNFAKNVRVISPTSGFDRTMTALRFPLEDPTSSSRFMFIDSYMTISPKFGATWSNTDGLKIRLATQGNFLGSPVVPTNWPINPGSILDLMPSPDMTRVAFLHQNLQAPATATIQVLNPTTGGIRVVSALPGSVGVAYGRGRECYVLQSRYGATNEGTNRLVCLDVETDPDLLPDPILETADLPGRSMAVTYRDSDDQVIVLCGATREIWLFDKGLTELEPSDVYFIPTSIQLGNTTGSIAVNPADGGIWFCTLATNNNNVYHMQPGNPPVFTTVPIPGVSNAYSLSFDDMGHMYVSTNGGLKELENVNGNWQLVQKPFFAGAQMNVGAKFKVSLSRTNYDPVEHGGPDWLNFDPDLNDEGVIVIDCPGDFNDDRLVGVPDLLMLINTWGPCQICVTDLNRDRTTGVPDLLGLINNWGPCPDDE